MSLVNETLRPETETRPRPRRSHISPRPRRDRDVGKMRLETVSRPRRRDPTSLPCRPYRPIGRIARSSLQQISFLVMFLTKMHQIIIRHHYHHDLVLFGEKQTSLGLGLSHIGIIGDRKAAMKNNFYLLL